MAISEMTASQFRNEGNALADDERGNAHYGRMTTGRVRRQLGPGNLHLINGLYDAHRSRVPVLAIAAHIPSREIGSGYFQETHPGATVP